MKERIRLGRTYNILFSIIFILAGCCTILWLIRNYLHAEDATKALIPREVSGKITAIQRSRGQLTLDIKNNDAVETLPSLPIARDFERYVLGKGDSLSKQAGETSITFYRRVNGGYKECFVYEDL